MAITNTWSVSDMQHMDSDGGVVAAATTASGVPW